MIHRTLILATLAAPLALAGCGAAAGTSTAADSAAASPRAGWVNVAEYISKRCDGSTLVYRQVLSGIGGLAVIPNSPECT